MAPSMDPFEGAASERQESQKALLEAIANAGAAGRKAYKDAAAEVERTRAAALDRAMQRSKLTGQDLGGADTAATTEASDRFGAYFSGQDAAREAQLGSIGASGESYLAKVSAIAPFMQQKAIQQAAERENLYKTEVAQNQAQIDAQKAAAEAAHRRQIELLNLRNQFDVQSDQRSTAARAPAAPKLPTADQLLGLGKAGADTMNTMLKAGSKGSTSTLRGTVGPVGRTQEGSGATLANVSADAMGDVDNAVFAANRMGLDIGPGGIDPVQAARYIAGSLGLDEATINGILTPAKTGAYTKAMNPAQAQDTVAKALATKYDTRGVTYELAQSALNGQDFHTFKNWMLNERPTRDEALDKLRRFFLNGEGRVGGNPGPWVAEYEILAGEYVPQLPKE